MSGPPPNGRVVLLGATGYTGRLVSRVLADADLPVLLTARDPERLERLASSLGAPPTGVVDVTRPGRVREVLRPGDVAINCVGPFLKLGEPVVRAAVEAGAHYLDTTGEQSFMLATYRRHHEAARDAGVAVVNAMAFEFALGDCAVALAARGAGAALRSVEVLYGWHGGASSTSRGTRASMLHVLAAGGVTYGDGEWTPEPVARRRRELDADDEPGGHAVSFPAGEIVTAPRYLDVDRIRGWIVTDPWTARLLSAAPGVLQRFARVTLPVLVRIVRVGPAGPDPEDRRSGGFRITAEAEPADGAVTRVTVSGQDPYGLTAQIIVAGARRLLAPPARPGELDAGAGAAPRSGSAGAGEGAPERPAGVLAPSRLVEPAEFLDGLASHGVRWERSSGDAGGPRGPVGA